MRYNINFGYGQGSFEAKTSCYEEMARGGRGCDLIFDNTNHIRNYYEIVPLSNITINNSTFFSTYSGTFTTSPALTTMTFPQGVSLKADFMSIQLRSGSALGFYMN